MAKTRAIRFSDLDERQIEEFLKRNEFFDFSTMARMAILEFIRNPKINVRAVGDEPRLKEKRPHGAN